MNKTITPDKAILVPPIYLREGFGEIDNRIKRNGFSMKLKERDSVVIKSTGEVGVIIGLKYNPYRILPKWMCSPTYLVRVEVSGKEYTGPHCLERKQLERL